MKIISVLRELPSDNLSKDKYANELDKRIKNPIKQSRNPERPTEPATAISWEKFFMRMAKLSQKRPGITPESGVTPVKYFCNQTIIGKKTKLGFIFD